MHLDPFAMFLGSYWHDTGVLVLAQSVMSLEFVKIAKIGLHG